MSKYFLVNTMPSAFDPITPKRKFEAFNPNSVTKIETTTAKINDCAIYKEAILSFFSP